MIYVERDGIWHIVALVADEGAVTLCKLRVVQPTHVLARQPIPLCSRCKAG